jgi:hypothetical protein
LADLCLYVDRALKGAGIPILGVAIEREDDKHTWEVSFAPMATEAHRAQAASLIASFTAPTPADLAEEVAQRDTQRKELKAVALALLEAMPTPKPTPAQLRDRIIALYKGL